MTQPISVAVAVEGASAMRWDVKIIDASCTVNLWCQLTYLCILSRSLYSHVFRGNSNTG